MPKRIPEPVTRRVEEIFTEAIRTGQKQSVDTIYDQIGEEYGFGVIGRTSVAKIVRHTKQIINVNVPPESPWNHSPTENAPEAYPFLLALNKLSLSLRGVFITEREAKWGRRLYAVFRDEPVEIAALVVGNLAIREGTSEMIGKEMQIDDIVGFLEYQPWKSNEAKDEYARACSLELIPTFVNPIDRFPVGKTPPKPPLGIKVSQAKLQEVETNPEERKVLLEQVIGALERMSLVQAVIAKEHLKVTHETLRQELRNFETGEPAKLRIYDKDEEAGDEGPS